MTITVDGRDYPVDRGSGRNLLDVCLSLGLDLPYFCWHPAMHSVGACRQCAVKVYKDAADTRGRIVMACMTAVSDGLILSVQDPEARAFRAGVIEWLMVNHPHDCPVCDEGGECHLQDMTVMAGHTRRRYRFEKRTHTSQSLGPFIHQEMNRCIQCYRCVRFYRDYAGGEDLDVQGWHDAVFFGRPEDGTLESQFSGNLCEVCPTGVFTDKTQRAHYARKWDLHTAPSVCPHCAVGCNTLPGSRLGSLRRIRPRYNAEVNGYFLCDRGRFGYEFVNAEARVLKPLVREAGVLVPATQDLALERTVAALKDTWIIGIGSERASLETNYALLDLVGPDNFFLATRGEELALHFQMRDTLASIGSASASPRRAASSDAVLVLGEDVWNTAPILGLALRQASRVAPLEKHMREKRIPRWDDASLREAIQDERGPFFVATSSPCELDKVAQASYRAAPDDLARLGFAVAREIDPTLAEPAALPDEVRLLAARIAAALLAAARPLVVSGCESGSPAVLRAAAAVHAALAARNAAAALALVFPRANSLGASLLLRQGARAAARGVEAAWEAMQTPGRLCLIVAEADLSTCSGPGFDAKKLFERADSLIVIDHSQSATTAAADIVLPSSAFAESSGTYVSSEGRAQRFFASYNAAAPVREAWKWLDELSAPRSLDQIIAAIAEDFPSLEPVIRAAPPASFRYLGRKVARAPLRESGRTAATAHINLREPKPLDDPDSFLSHSMEGYGGFRATPQSAAVARYWAPGWNSDQAINKFQDEMGGASKGGDSGARLFDTRGPAPAAAAMPATPPAIPAAFERRADALLLVPRHSSLGCEELSARSPGLLARAGEPCLWISPADAGPRGLVHGGYAELSLLPEGEGRLPVVKVALAGMPLGVASLSSGFPAQAALSLTSWASIHAAPAPQGGPR